MDKARRQSMVILIFFSFVIPSAFAVDMSAKEVMEKVENRDTGATVMRESTMILIDRKGRRRVRQTKMYSKETDEGAKAITFFLTPADVRNTAFLSHDWDDESKEDDSWLYLPALRKVKRIASADKSGAFMGSDFTYSDIEGVELENYDFTFVDGKENETVDGYPVWVIESRPQNAIAEQVIKQTGYLKSQAWIRKDNFMLVRGKFWVKKGKKIKYLTIFEIEKIQDIWTAKRIQMVTTKRGKKEHSTVLQTNSVQYNESLDDDMFTTHRMERGL